MNKRIIVITIILGFVLLYLMLLFGTNMLVNSMTSQGDEFSCGSGVCTVCYINSTKCLCGEDICRCNGIDVDRAECIGEL